jgi:hypothetical protein
MADARFNWLQSGDEPTAHYCCVRDSKAAAVCGYASQLAWHRVLFDVTACEKCEAIAKSGAAINFTMPDGSNVTVREQRK